MPLPGRRSFGLTTAQFKTCRGRTRGQTPVRQAHQGECLPHRARPARPHPMGWPGVAPQGADQAVSGRIANKNPIRCGRTGLDAVTRLRVGELRFRKGQDANVHRFIVAGGGPFLTLRCRDRSTHSIPQESSAGRNLITLFCDVNNPAQLFSGRGNRPVIGAGRDDGPLRADVTTRRQRRQPRAFRKALKKRHLHNASGACAARRHLSSLRARRSRIGDG